MQPKPNLKKKKKKTVREQEEWRREAEVSQQEQREEVMFLQELRNEVVKSGLYNIGQPFIIKGRNYKRRNKICIKTVRFIHSMLEG